ncbi:unnamed protein product [Paramecium octaurelia]|uniref:Uncharacterized protein n=1 Tax=Paramecium octaurelia TaxID=43137 RepID=A0A8S1WA11_PAROT|nr:unnamed protein product [Paramecium octaurelia]
MLKSLLLVHIFALVTFSKHIENQIIELEEVNYQVIIKVNDFSGYALSGVIVNVKNSNMILGDKDQMTDGTGMVTFTGKIPKQSSYQITAIATTTFNDISTSSKIDGVGDSQGTIVFNGKLQFTQSDVQVQDVFQRGLIILKTQSNSKPLPGVTVIFTAIYSEDKKAKELIFKATTDDKGQQNVRFLLPSQKPAFVILYTASKNEYWNAQQLNRNAQEFSLWPEKKYELPITINLDPGQFKFVLTALVQDQASKPLSGAKLQIGGINFGSNQELESLNAVSGTDGKISLILPLKATAKIHVKEQITKDEYIGQTQEFDEEFDLNVRKEQFTHDLGLIKLQEASGDLQISGIITDSSKQVQFVQGATIVFTILDSIQPVTAITDAQGKFKAEIYVPANKDLQLKATVTAKGFMNKIAAPRTINVSSKQPLQISFDVVLDRTIKNIKIKDKLVDPSGKAIQNAIVKIVESNPTMPDKTLYNKEITDNADGSFEYPFSCYEDIKFQATFQFQVPQFVPVTYKTGDLECKDQDLVKYSMTLSKQTAILLIKGQVIDVDQKPMKGVNLKFKSDPILDVPNSNLVTDANGNWQVEKLTVIPTTQYKFTIEYTNDIKQLVEVVQTFTPTMDKEQTFNFPVIGFQRYVKAKIAGKIAPVDGKAYNQSSEKKYELPITINLDPGQFKFVLTALVQDQASKPLSGAKLQIGGINFGSNQELESLNAVSGTDGKISLILPLKATAKIHVKEQITKDEYIGQTQEFDEEFDLNVRKEQFTHDLGLIKLQEASGDLQISGIITDSSKQVQFVQGATIVFTILDSIQPVTAITDAQGKFKAEIYVPANKDLQLKATVTAKGFMNKIAAPRTINVSSKQPLQISFDVVLDRTIKNIKIKDKLVDPSGKAIQNAIVKIVESNPTMPDKTLYNKEITDNADGSFEYPFSCYEDIKFQATFQFQVPQFVPVTYKTGDLECKDQDLVKYSMTLSKQTAILLIKGQVIDVDQKPMKGVNLKFKSDPILDVPNSNLVTDANGNWQVEKLTVIPTTQYKFTIEYTNDIKQLVEVVQTFTPTMDKEQTFNFPVIGFQRYVKAKIAGKIAPVDGKAAMPLPLIITCDGKGKDGKPIVIETTTKEDGSYSVDVEVLVGADKPLSCVVTNGNTGSSSGSSTGTGSTNAASPIQPIKVDVKVSAPTWSSNTNIPITYNTVDMVVKGVVSDKTKTITTVEGVDITLIITPQDVYIQNPGKHLLESYVLFKRHFQSTSQSILQTKSGKDGSYEFKFKAVQAYPLKFEIQAKRDPLFAPYEKKGIEEKCQKSETLIENIEIDRIRMLTKLHSTLSGSDKKPIINASVKMTSSDPIMKDSKYYNLPVKDDDKGSFFLDFECYKDFDYVVDLQIDVPQYVQQNIKSSKFKCSQALTELSPISLTLEKIQIKAILSGKVVDPSGNGVPNLALSITTDPESANLETKTLTDGTWTVTDPKIYPNTDYKAIIAYIDINKQQQKVEQKFTIQSDNQKVSIPDINYQAIVNAKIQGKIDLEKGTLSQPVKINLTCPKFKDAKGADINQDFSTDNNGNFDIPLQILAKHDDKIECNLKTKDSLQETTQKVELVAPKFQVQGVSIKAKFMTTTFTISGKLMDNSKVEDKLPGLKITITLKPLDPISNQPIISKSMNDGTFSIIIEVIRNVNYEATINVDAQPAFNVVNEKLQLLGKEDKQSISKDITLIRIVVDITVSGQLVDMNQKPIPNSKIEILSSDPQMTNAQLYNKQAAAPKGDFQLPFQCYNSVSTTLKMDMESDVYPKTALSPQVFTCGDKELKLKPIVVSTKSVQVTVSGVLSDSSGVTKNVQNAQIEIILNPADPLASNLQTKSDLNGKYSLSFGAVQDQIYTAVIQITNSDFNPYKSSNIQIKADKVQTLTHDATMDRIILQATLTSTITDPSGKPPPASTLTVESLQPTVKGNEKTQITGKTDSTGKFSLQVPCYKNVDESFILDVKADKYKDVKSDKIQFSCSGPALSLPPVKIKYELAPTNTKLTVGGEIIGPKGKGQSGVNVKLTSDPATKDFEVKTGADGKWSVLDDQLQFGTKYQLTESYDDAIGQNHKVTQVFQTNDEKSEMTFPKQYYDDFVPCEIDGKITTEGGIFPSNVPVSLQCDAFGENKVPIDLKTNTDSTGSYQFKWKMLMNTNSNVDCLLISHETAKFQQTNSRFKINPNNDVMKITNQAQVTEQFKAQLTKYYQFSVINGAVIAEFDCNSKLEWKGLEGVNIRLKQWNGIEYADLKIETKSDKDGLFVIKHQILKSQIQNEMKLEFTKQNYIPTTAEFNLYSFDPQLDGSYLIQLSNIRMVKIGQPEKCPPIKKNKHHQ